MKLIIMTKPTFFVEEDKILTTLFEEGLENLHLYKPNSAPMYSERLLTLLSDYCRKRITVHEHFYLKDEYRLKGIHIDNATSELPIGYKGNVSRTCRNLDELKVAKKQSDYVLLRNIFDSQTNLNEKTSFSLESLKDAARHGLIDRHVYAQGGINMENLRIIKDLGFGGVVICGDLWNRFDIHHGMDYKEVITEFEKLRKAIG